MNKNIEAEKAKIHEFLSQLPLEKIMDFYLMVASAEFFREVKKGA